MRVKVAVDGKNYIVVFDQEKGTALVRERVVIFEGTKRKFHEEQIRWFHNPALPPPPIPNPLYERVIELARSEL